jgi:hypothetical protein
MEPYFVNQEIPLKMEIFWLTFFWMETKGWGDIAKRKRRFLKRFLAPRTIRPEVIKY